MRAVRDALDIVDAYDDGLGVYKMTPKAAQDAQSLFDAGNFPITVELDE